MSASNGSHLSLPRSTSLDFSILTTALKGVSAILHQTLYNKTFPDTRTLLWTKILVLCWTLYYSFIIPFLFDQMSAKSHIDANLYLKKKKYKKGWFRINVRTRHQKEHVTNNLSDNVFLKWGIAWTRRFVFVFVMVHMVLVTCCKNSASFPQGTTETENGVMMVYWWWSLRKVVYI